MSSSEQLKFLFFNEDGTLTDKFSTLLKEIFMKYDLDKDGMLDREEIRNYFSTLNGEYLNDFSLNLALLKTCGHTDGFYLKDFYQFYIDQTNEDICETYLDLKKQFNEETIINRLR